MLSDGNYKAVRTFLVQILCQSPVATLSLQYRLHIHFAACPDPSHDSRRDLAVTQNKMDMQAMISVQALNATDPVIGCSLAAALQPGAKRPERSAHSIKIVRQMQAVIGTCIMGALKPKKSQL